MPASTQPAESGRLHTAMRLRQSKSPLHTLAESYEGLKRYQYRKK